MSIEVDVQYAVDGGELPGVSDIEAWVRTALAGRRREAQLTVRIVGEEEGAALNERWRGKRGPTNVLSFPVEGLEAVAPALLGDVVICAPVAAREALAQHKAPEAHWAHLVIHGTLHLLGFDHAEEEQAREMEGIETELLRRLGYADPYEATSQA